MSPLPDRPLRILHCPTAVGNQAPSLVRAERALGLDSRCITFEPHRFGYPVDEVLFNGNESGLKKEWIRWRFVLRALRDFDIAHFNFGTNLGPPLGEPGQINGQIKRLKSFLYRLYSQMLADGDLRLIKRFGKGIVVTYQGNDARQADYCSDNFEIFASTSAGPWEDQLRRKRIIIMDRYADLIFALNPDLMHVLPSRTEFLPYASVDVQQFRYEPTSNREPVIIHAPTNRKMKGTDHILRAVEGLEREGLRFKFRLIENMTHPEAMQAYREADLVIDQLLLGWYGGFAVEVMAQGKPVIAYIRDTDLHFIPDSMRSQLPVIQADPGSITEVLRYWIMASPEQLRLKGLESQRFVKRWHDPIHIAERMKAAYEQIAESYNRILSL